MAPPIKCFIIVFIVFYLCSYNGSLANIEYCTAEINILFRECHFCRDPNPVRRVKSYLSHILFKIAFPISNIKSYARLFILSIIKMRKSPEEDKPYSPEQYCHAVFTGDKRHCRNGLKEIFKENYNDRKKSVQKAYTDLSISLIQKSYRKYHDVGDAYMIYINEFNGVDTEAFITGTTPRSYCTIHLQNLRQPESSFISTQEYGQIQTSSRDQLEENYESQDDLWRPGYGQGHITHPMEASGQNWRPPRQQR